MSFAHSRPTGSLLASGLEPLAVQSAMRLVRCDSCGAKAMLAASQCPKCGHPLYVRDDRGATVPLVRCRGCDTLYPQSRTACRWCTERKPAPHLTRVAVVVIGIVVLSGASWGAWRLRLLPVRATGVFGRSAQVAVREQKPVHRAATALAPVVAPAVVVATVAASAPAPDSASVPARIDSSRARAAVKASTAPDSARNMETGGNERVFARATTWANVRAERNLESMIVGVILPDSVVELVEARGGWRRVSWAGNIGWVDHRLFAVDSTRRPRS